MPPTATLPLSPGLDSEVSRLGPGRGLRSVGSCLGPGRGIPGPGPGWTPSSLWEYCSYCTILAAGTTWNRMKEERMACLNRFCALEELNNKQVNNEEQKQIKQQLGTVKCPYASNSSPTDQIIQIKSQAFVANSVFLVVETLVQLRGRHSQRSANQHC